MFFGLRQLRHAADRICAVPSLDDADALAEAMLSYWIAYGSRDQWPGHMLAAADEVRRIITTGGTFGSTAETMDEETFRDLKARLRSLADEAGRHLAALGQG